MERWGKGVLSFLLSLFLPPRRRNYPQREQIQKVLVFRLDQRVGNGVMLVPLLRAIKKSLPRGELHLLINAPVALLLQQTLPGTVDRIWPYEQHRLLRAPWLLMGLLFRLRRERYDVIISCHNPDSFSLSQALWGILCRPRWLIGPDWGNSPRFYNAAVSVSNQVHYTRAMVDLWKVVDRTARVELGGLQVPRETRLAVRKRYAHLPLDGILLWLGATGRKAIPPDLLTYLYEQIVAHTSRPVLLACGPADREGVAKYPAWIGERTVVWNRPLVETAAFFSQFRCFISGDTGPAHLAVALGLPTLTLFIQSNARQYGYHDGVRHFVVERQKDAKTRMELNRALRELLTRDFAECGFSSRKIIPD